MSAPDPYPGAESAPQDILDLAEGYANAAQQLLSVNRKPSAPASAPARLCAIHAIELCQNAFLRHHGKTPEHIRGRNHCLEDAEFAQALRLRRKTAAHMRRLTKDREYLDSRYAPETLSSCSQFNRLTATLDEVLRKTRAHISTG